MTSSSMNTTPWRVQISRARRWYSSGGTAAP
jgi:hypothetical protein